MAKKKAGTKKPMRRFEKTVNQGFDEDTAVVSVALDQTRPRAKQDDEDDFKIPGRADGDPPELEFE